MVDNKRKTIISLAWLLLCYCTVCVYVSTCATSYIDADMSSELVLAKLLSEEHAAISENWYYSTELRVLNTQLVFAPLFNLFDSWQAVRAVGTALLLAIMVLCYVFMARSLNISTAGSFISAGVLLLPLSSSYTYSVLQGAFYIPHVCISFVLFGIICRTLSNNKRTLWTAFGGVLAFLAGLGGVRQVFVFTLPIIITAIIILISAYKSGRDLEKSKAFLIISGVMLIASGVGCLVNRAVLPEVYSFCNYGENTYGRDVAFYSFSVDGFAFFVNSIMELLGYHTGALFSGYLIYNVLFGAILLAVVFSVKQLLSCNYEDFLHKVTALFFIVAIALLGLIYCFTDLDRVARYCVPVVVFALPITAAAFERIKELPKLRISIAAAFLLLLAFCSANTYRTSYGSDANSELKAVISYLKSKDYDEGYSSFWSGNLVTELSDGDIEMHVVSSDIITSADGLQYVYKWLQEKAHDTDVPEGRFFLLLKNFEDDACNLPLQPELATETYVIYGFDEFSQFEALYK